MPASPSAQLPPLAPTACSFKLYFEYPSESSINIITSNVTNISKDKFQNLLFGTNLDSDAANLPLGYDMSVRDYFNEISNGKMITWGSTASTDFA